MIAGSTIEPSWAMGRARELLDQAERFMQIGRCNDALAALGAPLSQLADQLRDNQGAWDEFVRIARASPVFQLCLQDPYTHRAYAKPRGYAGDAVMMDLVYAGTPPTETSDIGRGVFASTTRGPMGLSVVFRRQLLRAYIDDAISRNPEARILSVASGHCRELEGSLAEAPLFRGEFVALDQDALSCSEVRWRHNSMRGSDRIRAVESSVKALIAGGGEGLGPFDLIYSAGLYDYLPTPVAARLTTVLGRLCKPEGSLLLANFVPDCHGRAYMEVIMDWHLTHRSEAEMQELAGRAGPGSARTFLDPHRNVVYVEWQRSEAS